MTAEAIPETFDRRASARVEVDRRAVLRLGSRVEDVLVEDLTCDGCRIRTSAELPPFARVSIGLAGVGHTPARLVWRSAEHYGCAFERPLPPSAGKAMAVHNVTQLAPPRVIDAPEPVDDKYSYPTRLLVIFGGSAALWGVIIGVALLVF